MKIRLRLGEQLTRRLMRWRSTAVPIVQTALAAGLSWLAAVHVVHHRAPFFAPVAAVVCLGMTLGQQFRRVIELIAGVGLGVGVGALLMSATGTGPWQIALLVALAMSVAVLLDGGSVITGQAAVSAILVATLCLPGDISGLNRLIDGVIGGATGLVLVGLFPWTTRLDGQMRAHRSYPHVGGDDPRRRRQSRLRPRRACDSVKSVF